MYNYNVLKLKANNEKQPNSGPKQMSATQSNQESIDKNSVISTAQISGCELSFENSTIEYYEDKKNYFARNHRVLFWMIFFPKLNIY